MKKLRLLGLVGITSIALTHAAWAGPHGGVGGGYVLDGYVGVHPFGIDPCPGPAPVYDVNYWPGHDVAAKFSG